MPLEEKKRKKEEGGKEEGEVGRKMEGEARGTNPNGIEGQLWYSVRSVLGCTDRGSLAPAWTSMDQHWRGKVGDVLESTQRIPSKERYGRCTG